MTVHLGQHLLTATLARFEAERTEAIATLNLYLSAPVGVGDHPNIVDEITQAVNRLAAAEEALETLKRHFTMPPPVDNVGNDE